MLRLAIQTVLYKSSRHLKSLLMCLKAQTFQDFKIFFYDNSELVSEVSVSRRLIGESAVHAHFIAGDRNMGFAGGHAALYGMHMAPFVMLLNDDVKLASDYLEKSMRCLEANPKIGSVTGLVYRWREDNESVIDTAGLEYRCLAQIVDRFAGELASGDKAARRESGEVFGASGAIGLYRREAIEKAGGLFDPSWFMYKEDADLALRLRKAGYIAWFEPSAIAWHRRGLAGVSGLWKRIADERRRDPRLRQSSYVNQWRIYKRHFSLSLGWRDILRSLMIELLRSIGTFIVSPRVFMRAWRSIVKSPDT